MPSGRKTTSRFRGDYLTAERELQIAELAEAVAETHFGDNDMVIPEQIAAAKGIVLIEGDYDGCFDGLLEHRGGRFFIYRDISRATTSARSRFTLAHELGHFYIDEHRIALKSGRVPSHRSLHEGRSKENPTEREADHFASSLLMPPGWFAKVVCGESPGIDLDLKVQTRFDVSVTSAVIRVVELDLCPCVAIKWNPDGTNWKRPSTQARRLRLAGATVDVEHIPEGSATAMVKGGEQQGVVTCASVASAWFPAIAPGSQRDLLLQEEAMTLRSYGAITFLRTLEI